MKLLLTALLLSARTFASTQEADLVNKYIKATRLNDPRLLRELLHSKAAACIQDKNKDGYAYLFSQIAEKKIPAAYKQKSEAPDPEVLKKQVAFIYGPESSLPVMPTIRITIQYEVIDTEAKTGCRKFHLVDDKKSVTHLIDVAQDGKKLGLVVPCISQSAIEKFRSMPQIKLAAKTKAKERAQKLRPESKAELVKILKTGKTLDAIKLYSAKEKTSLSEAYQVMDELCDQM